MTRRLFLLIDILTFIFVLPAFFCLTATTGLLLGQVFDLDSYVTTPTQTPARRPIRRYVVLPRATPAPAAVTEPDLAVEASVSAPIEVPPAQPQPVSPATAVEHDPEPAVAPTMESISSAPAEHQAQATLPDPTEPSSIESQEADLVEETSIPTLAEDVPSLETPAESDSPTAPEDLEVSQDNLPPPGEDVAAVEPSTPAAPAAPADPATPSPTPVPPTPTPVPRAPVDPPPGLGSSFFDDLLEQVKQ